VNRLNIFGQPLTISGQTFLAIGSIAEGFVLSKTEKIKLGSFGDFQGQPIMVIGVFQNKTTTTIRVRTA